MMNSKYLFKEGFIRKMGSASPFIVTQSAHTRVLQDMKFSYNFIYLLIINGGDFRCTEPHHTFTGSGILICKVASSGVPTLKVAVSGGPEFPKWRLQVDRFDQSGHFRCIDFFKVETSGGPIFQKWPVQVYRFYRITPQSGGFKCTGSIFKTISDSEDGTQDGMN